MTAERDIGDDGATWRAFLEVTKDVVVKLDRARRIREINRAVGSVAPSRLLGTDLALLAVPEQRDHVRERLEQLLADGTPVELELEQIASEGAASRWHAVRAAPIRGPSGITGAIAVLRDITSRRHTDARLIVSDRIMSIGSLAAGVAHEINNPLAAVVANLEFAHRSTLDDGPSLDVRELRELLEDARQAADRVRDIVRDLRLFSRSWDDDRPHPVDVHAVLDSTLRLAWYEIRHRARLEKSFGEVPPVSATESRLGQVFLNLVLNAAQAIPEGDSATNRIRITTSLVGARVAVEISDTGQGITEEVRERLFEPFFTTKPVGVGTGLGLAICHRLLAGWGGAISVRSEPGSGSVFTVLLPVAAPSESRPPATGRAPSAPRGRVLVIDDDPMVGSVIKRVLSAYEVTALVGADVALARIRSGEVYDAILCDLMMPRMSGMDLHQELSGSHPEAAERLIFLTGGAFSQAAREFLDRVPNLRLEKPFDVHQLRQIVASMVD